MGSKPPHPRKGTQGFPFQTLPHRSETTGRKAAQTRLQPFSKVEVLLSNLGFCFDFSDLIFEIHVKNILLFLMDFSRPIHLMKYPRHLPFLSNHQSKAHFDRFHNLQSLYVRNLIPLPMQPENSFFFFGIASNLPQNQT